LWRRFKLISVASFAELKAQGGKGNVSTEVVLEMEGDVARGFHLKNVNIYAAFG
jgi:hypothetical protein